MIDISKISPLMDRAEGASEETLESAGCTGQCPMYPGAPKTEDGYPDCTKCPKFNPSSCV